MTDVVNLEDRRNERGDIKPLNALKNIVANIENGNEPEPDRLFIISENGGDVQIYGSGLRQDCAVIEGLGLIELGRAQLIRASEG